ncbi:hypothetical protein [Selenomonas sp.]|uniref:hypothetical protein n=1 Tax=Selenomonas sp. TaxID=2053611 RepID=UPI0025D273B2|nr:hypothetical protein [Selenomonas sp.]MCI6084888.1 hypothetical protein [Selenomonas sp.]MDY3296895.1 hypothetical protein [Selenomonas sp.]
MANHQYKDSVFRMLFNDPVELAKLYQALCGEAVQPDDLTITTLNDVLFDSIKNDLSFEWKNEAVVLMEHQSTWNENMPKRMLSYASRLLDKMFESRDAIYGQDLVFLPDPSFYMFYIGEKPPKKKVLRLSDAFRKKSKNLELVCKVIDISYARGKRFLRKCEPLQEYSFFIDLIDKNRKSGMATDIAIHEAVMYCKKQKILLQVLDRYEKEVIDVVSLWWNEEDARKYAEKKKKEDIEKATAAERASMILGMLHEHLSLDSILRISKGTSEEVLSIAKKNGLVVE